MVLSTLGVLGEGELVLSRTTAVEEEEGEEVMYRAGSAVKSRI